MLRARATTPAKGAVPFDIVVLTHHERHLRRRVLVLQHGDELLVDLPAAVALVHGDYLRLDDGRHVEVIAAEENLIEVRAAPTSLAEIAWHLGNRHTPAQIESARILVADDHVIAEMLRGLLGGRGAILSHVSEPFEPLRGAYHQHGSSSSHHAGGGVP
jgi:urease accessory protein